AAPAAPAAPAAGVNRDARADAHASPERWKALVTASKALHAWQRTLPAPAWLGAPPQAPSPVPSHAQGTQSAEDGTQEADAARLLISAQRAASGRRTGRVRLVPHDARDAALPDVQPGDVLVAHSAGALWGPLAPAVAGIVLERGSPFMHVMVVCREYGVPGVVNAKDAMQTLRDGQLVEVDGDRGWVLAADT
ncbi:MAG TPA: PEP-utilizing enzyme, partial [Chloroflexota bacterium]|nr:PEP-utilizing enzyme [Chloroflexota bacterium]